MSLKVALLGATRAVGQRFIQLLENHLWRVCAVARAGILSGELLKEKGSL